MKYTYMIIVTILVISSMNSCKKVDNRTVLNENDTYQTTYGDKHFDNITLTVMLFDRNNAPNNETVINNRWTEYINLEMSKVGIHIKFIPVPRSEELTKVNAMMASDTPADIMMCYNASLVQDFYIKGDTLNLSPYIDGNVQARNLKDYIGKDVLDISRLSNGERWAIPARRSCNANYNLFIRKDWLDALGLQIPKTLDEMYNVLYQFKYHNPDDREDIIASYFRTDGGIGPMACSFLESIIDDKSFAIGSADINGSLVYYDNGYVEYLRFLNKLYHEGLMDPEFYTNNNFGQIEKEYFINGQLGVFEMAVNSNVDTLRGNLLKTLQKKEPEAEIISIPPLANQKDGNIYNSGYSKYGAFIFIPKSCTNVEAAITYLDWLATKEGGYTLFHGFEGEHYELMDSIPVVKEASYNALTKDWIRHDLFLVGNQGYYKTLGEFIIATSKEVPGMESYVLENYRNATVGIKSAPPYNSLKETEQSANLRLICDDYLVKSITCNQDDFYDVIKEFIGELKKYDIEDIIKNRTNYFTDYYGY